MRALRDSGAVSEEGWGALADAGRERRMAPLLQQLYGASILPEAEQGEDGWSRRWRHGAMGFSQ